MFFSPRQLNYHWNCAGSEHDFSRRQLLSKHVSKGVVLGFNMMMEEFEREQVLAALSFKPKDDRVGDFEKSFICDEEYSEKIF